MIRKRITKKEILERVRNIAQYIILTGATVRAAAKMFHVSKSTVYNDIVTRLQGINKTLYARVKAIMSRNKAERCIRGGQATRAKYQAIRSI